MFNALLKSKFQIKCKSSIKVTNMRLEIIKKKRIAMQKYLMNDIVCLVQDGLDSNAYARAGAFLEEMNISSCYEYVEFSCLCISTHLSAMCKDRECLEDCREAVSTLMFAAARFADLPELRELRSLFTERYGKSVESYVNKEFVAKLKSVSSSKDKKLELLQDIAHESGIEWSSKALEQHLYKPPAVERPPSDEQNASRNISAADRNEQDNQMVISGERKQEFFPHRKDEITYDFHEIPKSRRTPSKVIQGNKIDQNVWQSKYDPASLSREEVDGDKSTSTYISVPPTYTSPTVSKTNPILDRLPKGFNTEGEGSRKLDVQLDKKSTEIPKSVRTRRAKPLDPPPVHDSIGSSKGNETSKNSDGKEQDDDEQNMHDLSNEEEIKMDKFLMHYSNKNATPEPRKEATKSRDKEYSLQSRAASLPVKPTSPEVTKRGHTRATSYQTDTNANGYVHPKLPDYDDFVARLVALRGNGR
ncbi:uncharacterized protein LOC141661391 [Apium graveolens]|uniref:uncharacterized protein LOC141661391 n=1 Tax=Apium graveolens TaxID=4045 RepID=UPI003D790257